MKFDSVRVPQQGMDPRVASFAEIAMRLLLTSLIAGRVQLMVEQSYTVWVTRDEKKLGAVFTTLIVNGENNEPPFVHIEQVPIAEKGGAEKCRVDEEVRVIQLGNGERLQRPTTVSGEGSVYEDVALY